MEKELRLSGISQDKLIANEKDLTITLNENDSRKFVHEELMKMSSSERVVSKLMRIKIIKANADFDTIFDIYLENKEDSLRKWLSQSITINSNVIETIVNFLQNIFTEICK